MRFRPVVPPADHIVKWLLIALSCFHYYTAGFGLLRETTHRGVHLAFVLGLIFLVFAASKKALEHPRASSLLAPGGVPLVDWLLGLACAASVLRSEERRVGKGRRCRQVGGHLSATN